MAKLFTGRVAVIVAIALAGGAVAAGVAEADSGSHGGAGLPAGSGRVATAVVVRTDLIKYGSGWRFDRL